MSFPQDVRYCFRTLRKSAGFTVTAVIAVALGIGANTAIFSLVNAVLIRPFPYQDPSRLVLVRERIPRMMSDNITMPAADIQVYREQNRSFLEMGGFQSERMDLTGMSEPVRLESARMGAGAFRALAVAPLLGRYYTDDEDERGSKLVVLSHAIWQSKFGRNRNILGRTVNLDRKPYTVIGVMPKDFLFPLQGMLFSRPADVWIPLSLTKKEREAKGDNFNFSVIARLKPNVSMEQANADMNVIARRIHDRYPPEIQSELTLEAAVVPVGEEVVGKVRTLLWLLLGSVSLLLLIACANVANLLLSRAAARGREMSIRSALGAGRWRMVRQLLTESLILSLVGGALGVLIAWWSLDLLSTATAAILPRASETRLDQSVLAFSILLSILTGALFGVIPAFSASRTNLQEGLREGGRSVSLGLHRSRTQAILVVGEIALALVLMVGAGLLFRSFLEVRGTDPGFSTDQMLTMSVSLPETRYRTGEDVRSFYRELQTRLEALPGVTCVGIGTDVPVSGANWTRFFTVENQSGGAQASPPLSAHSLTNQNYFQSLGIPLKAGRLLTDSDRQTQGRAIVINETMAHKFWPGQDAIGKRVKWGPPQSDEPWNTVVGIVGDIKDGPLDQPARSHTYETFSEQPASDLAGMARSLWVAVRAGVPPQTLTTGVRKAIWSIDRELPIANLQTMQTRVEESMSSRRVNTYMLVIFAGTALLLAAIGIYGVMAYSVTQRTREFGIRMTLGARGDEVRAMVVRQGLTLALAGIGIGLLCSLAVTRFMTSLLYGVTATDTITFAAVAVFLALVALLATWLPAQRATRVDPMVALRYE